MSGTQLTLNMSGTQLTFSCVLINNV